MADINIVRDIIIIKKKIYGTNKRIFTINTVDRKFDRKLCKLLFFWKKFHKLEFSI